MPASVAIATEKLLGIPAHKGSKSLHCLPIPSRVWFQLVKYASSPPRVEVDQLIIPTQKKASDNQGPMSVQRPRQSLITQHSHNPEYANVLSNKNNDDRDLKLVIRVRKGRGKKARLV